MCGEWSTGFGWVIVNGVRYRHDVIIMPDGSVVRRRKELSAKYRERYGHTPLSPEEFRDLLRACGNVDVVIVGTGQYGDMPVMEDVVRVAEEAGVKLIIERTPNALKEIRELLGRGVRAAALIHVTC